MKVAQFELEAGGSVLVEVNEAPYEDAVGRGQDIVDQVGISFDRACPGSAAPPRPPWDSSSR